MVENCVTWRVFSVNKLFRLIQLLHNKHNPELVELHFEASSIFHWISCNVNAWSEKLKSSIVPEIRFDL